MHFKSAGSNEHLFLTPSSTVNTHHQMTKAIEGTNSTDNTTNKKTNTYNKRTKPLQYTYHHMCLVTGSLLHAIFFSEVLKQIKNLFPQEGRHSLTDNRVNFRCKSIRP